MRFKLLILILIVSIFALVNATLTNGTFRGQPNQEFRINDGRRKFDRPPGWKKMSSSAFNFNFNKYKNLGTSGKAGGQIGKYGNSADAIGINGRPSFIPNRPLQLHAGGGTKMKQQYKFNVKQGKSGLTKSEKYIISATGKNGLAFGKGTRKNGNSKWLLNFGNNKETFGKGIGLGLGKAGAGNGYGQGQGLGLNLGHLLGKGLDIGQGIGQEHAKGHSQISVTKHGTTVSGSENGKQTESQVGMGAYKIISTGNNGSGKTIGSNIKKVIYVNNKSEKQTMVDPAQKGSWIKTSEQQTTSSVNALGKSQSESGNELVMDSTNAILLEKYLKQLGITESQLKELIAALGKDKGSVNINSNNLAYYIYILEKLLKENQSGKPNDLSQLIIGLGKDSHQFDAKESSGGEGTSEVVKITSIITGRPKDTNDGALGKGSVVHEHHLQTASGSSGSSKITVVDGNKLGTESGKSSSSKKIITTITTVVNSQGGQGTAINTSDNKETISKELHMIGGKMQESGDEQQEIKVTETNTEYEPHGSEEGQSMVTSVKEITGSTTSGQQVEETGKISKGNEEHKTITKETREEVKPDNHGTSTTVTTTTTTHISGKESESNSGGKNVEIIHITGEKIEGESSEGAGEIQKETTIIEREHESEKQVVTQGNSKETQEKQTGQNKETHTTVTKEETMLSDGNIVSNQKDEKSTVVIHGESKNDESKENQEEKKEVIITTTKEEIEATEDNSEEKQDKGTITEFTETQIESEKNSEQTENSGENANKNEEKTSTVVEIIHSKEEKEKPEVKIKQTDEGWTNTEHKKPKEHTKEEENNAKNGDEKFEEKETETIIMDNKDNEESGENNENIVNVEEVVDGESQNVIEDKTEKKETAIEEPVNEEKEDKETSENVIEDKTEEKETAIEETVNEEKEDKETSENVIEDKTEEKETAIEEPVNEEKEDKETSENVIEDKTEEKEELTKEEKEEKEDKETTKEVSAGEGSNSGGEPVKEDNNKEEGSQKDKPLKKKGKYCKHKFPTMYVLTMIRPSKNDVSIINEGVKDLMSSLKEKLTKKAGENSKESIENTKDTASFEAEGDSSYTVTVHVGGQPVGVKDKLGSGTGRKCTKKVKKGRGRKGGRKPWLFGRRKGKGVSRRPPFYEKSGKLGTKLERKRPYTKKINSRPGKRIFRPILNKRPNKKTEHLNEVKYVILDKDQAKDVEEQKQMYKLVPVRQQRKKLQKPEQIIYVQPESVTEQNFDQKNQKDITDPTRIVKYILVEKDSDKTVKKQPVFRQDTNLKDGYKMVYVKPEKKQIQPYPAIKRPNTNQLAYVLFSEKADKQVNFRPNFIEKPQRIENVIRVEQLKKDAIMETLPKQEVDSTDDKVKYILVGNPVDDGIYEFSNLEQQIQQEPINNVVYRPNTVTGKNFIRVPNRKKSSLNRNNLLIERNNIAKQQSTIPKEFLNDGIEQHTQSNILKGSSLIPQNAISYILLGKNPPGSSSLQSNKESQASGYNLGQIPNSNTIYHPPLGVPSNLIPNFDTNLLKTNENQNILKSDNGIEYILTDKNIDGPILQRPFFNKRPLRPEISNVPVVFDDANIFGMNRLPTKSAGNLIPVSESQVLSVKPSDYVKANSENGYIERPKVVLIGDLPIVLDRK